MDVSRTGILALNVGTYACIHACMFNCSLRQDIFYSKDFLLPSPAKWNYRVLSHSLLPFFLLPIVVKLVAQGKFLHTPKKLDASPEADFLNTQKLSHRNVWGFPSGYWRYRFRRSPIWMKLEMYTFPGSLSWTSVNFINNKWNLTELLRFQSLAYCNEWAFVCS